MKSHAKPPRPLGLSLAIMVSVFVFAIIPLVSVAVLLQINNRVYNVSDTGEFSGISLPGFAPEPLLVYAATAIFFLVMGLVAWRGRVPAMRVAFPALNVLYGLVILLSLGGESSVWQEGMDSLQATRDNIRVIYLAVMVMVVIYVTWFMNRWSARAFYRGHYTTYEQ
ncbi:MAG: hypothetical protein MUE40_19750, partial [Anaerolineae bacterium]|nr:hypothetical protein [Anaerolineae bacterium]